MKSTKNNKIGGTHSDAGNQQKTKSCGTTVKPKASPSSGDKGKSKSSIIQGTNVKNNPMSDEETILEMRYLYNHDAETYARYACDHLVLDTIIEKEPPLDPAILKEMSELDQLVARLNTLPGVLSRENPKAYTFSLYFDKFRIHYIFPNLSSKERLVIEGAASDASYLSMYKTGDNQAFEEIARKRL